MTGTAERRAWAARQKARKAVAYKAITIAPKLSGAARRVAGALIDHFNLKTGQCDPSVGRLATMLGLNRATVLRATAELCAEEDGLFAKKSHGGHWHRAHYQPRWRVLRAIVADWDARMVTGGPIEKPVSKVAKMRRSRSQSCDSEGRRIATQNHVEPFKKTMLGAQAVAQGARSQTPEKVKGPTRALNKRTLPERQQSLLLPIPGGRAALLSHREAAFAAAERRLNEAVRDAEKDRGLSLQSSEAVADAWPKAVAAEMERPKSGLSILIAAFDAEGRAPADWGAEELNAREWEELLRAGG